MLAAQKRSTVYEYGEHEYYVPEHEKKSKVKKLSNAQLQTNGFQKAKTIFCVFLCFSIAFFIMFRYVAIAEASNMVENYKKQLVQVQRTNEQMQVELDRSIDLKKVEETARTKLDMRRPEKYQISYVKLEKDDYAEVIHQQPSYRVEKNSFAAITNIITNVLEYLY